MKSTSRIFTGLATVCGVCLLGSVLMAGQAAPQETSLPAEQYFKNVQVLKGLPVDEFLETMGMFAAATGLNCTDCHVDESGGSWERYADDNQLKRTTRAMVGIMTAINKQYFGGRQGVTCYSCHNGNRRPKVIPNLAVQYAVNPLIEDAYEILEPAFDAPTIDAVLDRYIAAVGGAARLKQLTTFIAEGTYSGYDDFEEYPVQVFARAPNQRTTILRSQYGDTTTTFDGRSGWQASPVESKPLPVVALTGGNLEGTALEAELSFPGQIKQVLTNWVVGPADRDRRSRSAHRPGEEGQRHADQAVFRRGVRSARAPDPVLDPVARRPRADADRFRGLPRRVRNQVPVQVDLDVDEWTDGPPAEERPDQSHDSCGDIREAGAAGTACGALTGHPAGPAEAGHYVQESTALRRWSSCRGTPCPRPSSAPA